mgnify:CR=1 FL=1
MADRPRRAAHLAAYGFYLGVALLVTWPAALTFSTRFIGHPFGDSYEYARFIWWFVEALRTGQSPFFQPLLAYPDGLPSALLWSIPLQSFPAWLFAFALPLPAAFNLAAILRLALNGWALYWAASRLTGSRLGALLGGVIFLAFPAMQGQLAAGHTGLLALWPLPLYAYHLLRLRGDRSPRRLLLAAGCFLLGVLGSNQLLVFGLLPLTALALLGMALARDWPALRRGLAAGALGAALAVVFILPGLLEALAAPPWTRERGDVFYSADLLSLVTPSFQHPVFGHLDYTHRVLGIDPFEKPAYVGLAAAGLAAVGAWRRPASRLWLALAAVAGALALGPLLKVLDTPVTLAPGSHPTYVTLPWALYQQLPPFNIVRAPARFNLAVGLALAFLAAYGCSALGLRGRRGWGLALLAAGLTLWEYQVFWPGMPTIPGDIPPGVAALAERPDVRAVLDIPTYHLLAAKTGLYLQTTHRRPLIAGQITRRTPVDPAKLALLEGTLDPALLRAAGADVIILHREWDETGLEAFARARLGPPIYEDERFAVFDAPPADAPPGFVALPARPGSYADRAESFVYAPARGALRVQAALTADARTAALRLDGRLIAQRAAAGEWTLDLWAAATPGYHTLALALEPPCPASPSPALACGELRLDALALTFVPD